MNRRPVSSLSKRQRRRLISNKIQENIKTGKVFNLFTSEDQPQEVQPSILSCTSNFVSPLNILIEPELLSEDELGHTLSESVSDSGIVTKNFESLIRLWAVKNNLTHIALSELLKILHEHWCFNYLLDSRTLLKTPTFTRTRVVKPGRYCHFGIEKGIVACLEKGITGFRNKIEVQFNIDGVPLHHSTNKQFWAILGSVVQAKSVFVVGIYEGDSKPSDVNDFLKDFVDEGCSLYTHGVKYNNQILNFLSMHSFATLQLEYFW